MWVVQKVFKGYFSRSGRKTDLKTRITSPKHFQCDLFLCSWPWMTLTLNMLAERLGWSLQVSQTRSNDRVYPTIQWSMLLYWLISVLHGCSARKNQIRQIVKHFDFDLTRGAIGDPEVNNLMFASINFPDLLNAVCFCFLIGPVVSEVRAVGCKNSTLPRQSCCGNTPVSRGLRIPSNGKGGKWGGEGGAELFF